jgi:hypothetical protein
MWYPNLDDFFQKYFRTGQHWNKKIIGMQDAKWQELQDDTFIQNRGIQKGSIFKCFETTNFGWIVFQDGTLDTFGNPLSPRIFKF